MMAVPRKLRTSDDAVGIRTAEELDELLDQRTKELDELIAECGTHIEEFKGDAKTVAWFEGMRKGLTMERAMVMALRRQ